MTAWKPAPERARIRNGTVVSVSGGNATVRMDGSVDVPNLPVYGTVAAGQGVLVLEQGASLLVLGPGGDLTRADADARYASPTYAAGRFAPNTTVPNGTVTRMSITADIASGCTVASNTVTVTRNGFYLIQATATVVSPPGSGQRAFIDILVASTVGARVNFGPSEDRTSTTALALVSPSTGVTFNIYQAQNLTNTVNGGNWSLKYLGGQ